MGLVLLAATMINVASADSPDIRTYSYRLSSLTVHVDNPRETYPNQTITLNITVIASAQLTINQTKIELYTFDSSTMQDDVPFDEIVHASGRTLIAGESLPKSYNIRIPEYAYNIVYGRLVLLWTEGQGTDESTTYDRKTYFVMMCLKNPELEMLRNRVPELELEKTKLEENITELNKALVELHENLTDIQNRYTELEQNLTDVQHRYEGEISGSKSLIAFLAITTIIFVGTTAFLSLRKPKQYW